MAGAGRRGSTYRSSGKRGANDLSLNEMFGELSSALNQQAVQPNLYGYVPHEKQEIFHKSHARQKLFIGGNRSGKTAAGVVEDLWWVTRRHPYRQIPSDVAIRGRVLGDGFENGTINKVLIPTIKRWVIPSDLINGSWEDSWNNSAHTLTLDNGSFIEFKSYDQEVQKHAGTSLHFIHFDEEMPRSIYSESMLRLVDTFGSWWATLTPLNGLNWTYDELFVPMRDGNTPDSLVVEVETADNPHVELRAVLTLLSDIDANEREARLKGKFVQPSGLIFPEFNEDHLIEGPWYPNYAKGWRVFQSLDHGFTNPTAALWHAVSPDNEVVTFGEHYKTQMIVQDHAKAIKEFEADHGIMQVFARPGDPAMKQKQGVTGTSIVQEYANNGVYLNVDNIPRDVKTGLDRMHMYLKKNESTGRPYWRIVRTQCPNLIKELKRLARKRYASSKQRDLVNVPEEVQKKDDHAFDSTRYFFTMMPDLAPDAEPMGLSSIPVHQRSFIDVMVEMTKMSQEQRWIPQSSGFSEEEYGFSDNLEMSW